VRPVEVGAVVTSPESSSIFQRWRVWCIQRFAVPSRIVSPVMKQKPTTIELSHDATTVVSITLDPLAKVRRLGKLLR